MKSLIYIAIAISLFMSCSKKDSVIDSSEYADLSIEFDHIVGGQKLVLNTVQYYNSLDEDFTVDLLQYFISNIQLEKADGTQYFVPLDSSYFLIDATEEGRFAKFRVPVGDYHKVRFVLGVDSLRNTMDISERTGVLDPALGMYWGWNSGYIFFKIEGKSAVVPSEVDANQKYRWHIGGFGGYNTPTINNIKIIELSLTERGISQVRTNRRSNIHLMVDIGKVFENKDVISIASHSQIMFSDFSSKIANNYADMFVHDHTEN